MSPFIETITSDDPSKRNRAVDQLASSLRLSELVTSATELEDFRTNSKNLYHTVRALFFLYAIYRFHIPRQPDSKPLAQTPFSAVIHLRERRFEEAIQSLLRYQAEQGLSAPIASGLAAAYHGLAFQKLADQVRRSVQSAKGNQWMFRVGHPIDHPLSVVPSLGEKDSTLGTLPILCERTPVRMDLCHSAWSDIFFLGMDYPEGARVLNTSIDLGVLDRDEHPSPPVEAYFRVIDTPILRLTSVDLNASVSITDLSEVFDFAKDYLGLLKAAIIASGIIPPGLEGSGHKLEIVLERLVGPGHGVELVSCVNDIPKGSRLAVSTNLLGALIAVCMRATGQIRNLTGELTESDRRTIAARAILGEWLGGSGGGWQDSGGIWPGIKLIEGVFSTDADPEHGVSRGCLLPRHTVLSDEVVPPPHRKQLQSSLVLVHGGMAQNVGPVLEMVTEKYLLRSEKEWRGRLTANQLLEQIVDSLKDGDIKQLALKTTENFFGPIQTIIPWATNHYTESLIKETQKEFGDDFWGFCMLGGMAGGGMAFFFSPEHRPAGQRFLQRTMKTLKDGMENGLPFAMDPIVYEFQINDRGSVCERLAGKQALMPQKYYNLLIPDLIRKENKRLSSGSKAELRVYAEACRSNPIFSGALDALFNQLLPSRDDEVSNHHCLRENLSDNGFDPVQHEQIKSDLKVGRIGLAQNRLPASTNIEDVSPAEIANAEDVQSDQNIIPLGQQAISNGEVAVVTLTAGVGSRWTSGAGTVKAVNPYCQFAGKHRTFVETHLAKSRATNQRFQTRIPHVFTTSYLTHSAIQTSLTNQKNFGYEGPLLLSHGRSIGLRLIPMARDLRFAWEETSQQRLDEQKEKLRESVRSALLRWALDSGEGTDYTDNLPSQCMHPIGHWYEFTNLLRNGTLKRLLESNPRLKHLFMHNVDTLGANLDPALLGYHIDSQAALTFEVIPRWLEDQGGGLARVDGRLRLLEGLSIPNEADEFKLSYYNSNTNWINLEQMLSLFELTKEDLGNEARITQSVRRLAARIPTYVTLKEVKRRWGHGQEDIFPVAQFEKIWGDMTSLHELHCRYVVVPRPRGQQLKEPAQLDCWVRDGTAAYVDSLCAW